MTQVASDLSAKEAVLDTAERLFSASGFDGVSLRELTREAGTNLAAVNYHFGSKEKLFEEVILRRIRPINEQRLASLRIILEAAGEGRPSLAAVLETFARPFVVGTGMEQREALHQIAVRLFMESDPLVKPIFEREFFNVSRQFRAALARARPDLEQRQVDMGLIFYVGAMVNLLASEKRRAMLMQWTGPAPTDEQTLQFLIRFGVAGFAGLANAATQTALPGPAQD